MIYLVIILLVFIILAMLKKAFSTGTQYLKGWFIKYQFWIVCIVTITLTILLPKIMLCVLAVGAISYITSIILRKKRLKQWEDTGMSPLDTTVIDETVQKIALVVAEIDRNADDHKFIGENLPYGRSNAFLNYFGRNLEEEIYYFSAIPSKNENELREYGIAVTGSGIFISTQKGKKKSRLKEILFAGLEDVSYDSSTETLIVTNVVRYGIGLKKTRIEQNETTVVLSGIASTLSSILHSQIPQALFEGNVTFGDAETTADLAEERLKSDIKLGQAQKDMANVGTVTGAVNRQEIYDETGNFMNASQGHGYAAEYASKTMDRLMGKSVVGVQEMENGHQALNGADKIVNGQKVQIKYCRSATETYRNAFKTHSYPGQKIEVPRNQYNEIKAKLQQDIDAGNIEGIQPGTPAQNLLIKGFFTVDQVHRIAAAGSIEGVSIDLASGVITAVPGATITALYMFATAIWNGQDLKGAAKAGITTAGRIIGKSAIIFTITMQVNREYLWILNTGPGAKNTKNPLNVLSKKAADKISTSALAKSSLGKRINLDTMNVQKLTNGVVTIAVIFGPDVCRFCAGKISVKQLAKNATIGAAGVAGASAGTILTGGNPVGGIIGGAVAGAVTKKVADSFVEDDAIQMFRVLKEEFLDVVLASYLTKLEFEEVAANTIFSKKVAKELGNMYKASKKDEHRAYARKMIEDAVIDVLKKRRKVTDEMWQTGQKMLLSDETTSNAISA